ncbi:MAG: hypothetical protein IAX21_10785 [Candidatus Bathyarchaeota archaeon]|nr:MAG: hypothetical protein IAX21_10785 [Candidatus Bathyarchaeota archaeon]
MIETAENECKDRLKNIKNNLSNLQNLLLEVSKQKTYTFTMWVLGEDIEWKIENDLDLLDKAGLICAKTRYSDQGGYLEYSLKEKGKNIVEKIENNSS